MSCFEILGSGHTAELNFTFGPPAASRNAHVSATRRGMKAIDAFLLRHQVGLARSSSIYRHCEGVPFNRAHGAQESTSAADYTYSPRSSPPLCGSLCRCCTHKAKLEFKERDISSERVPATDYIGKNPE